MVRPVGHTPGVDDAESSSPSDNEDEEYVPKPKKKKAFTKTSPKAGTSRKRTRDGEPITPTPVAVATSTSRKARKTPKAPKRQGGRREWKELLEFVPVRDGEYARVTCGFPNCEEVLCVKNRTASVDHVIDAHYVRSDVVGNRVDKFKCDWGDCTKTPKGYDIKRHMLQDGPAKGASSSEPCFSRFAPEAAEGGGRDNDSLRALCPTRSP
ncbi:hypothetical protein C8Q76DRAFT_694458 [Earliella scabrosa]|nr:hypothetical protein C8Q76DRAFT_694458 [Earliella scabrosa]